MNSPKSINSERHFVNVCLFAHFDRDNIIDPYVLNYITEINRSGFDIIFISTSKLSNSEVLKAKSICREVLLRENKGLDFGSWCLGYSKFGHEYSGELLLANDSVYGPLGNLNDVFISLRRTSADVCGLVESLQSGQHLQSWFLLFSSKAHRSEIFKTIFNQDFSSMKKQEIILAGEVGLSEQLRQAGLTTSAIFSFKDRRSSLLLNYNPSHTAWRQLIEVFGVPFLKVELLRDNPLRLTGLYCWQETVRARAPEMVDLIENHLNRVSESSLSILKSPKKSNFISHQEFIARDISYQQRGHIFRRELNQFCFSLLIQCRKAIYLFFYGITAVFMKMKRQDQK
jgi:lipopolysaccharide biosynthesis protein